MSGWTDTEPVRESDRLCAGSNTEGMGWEIEEVWFDVALREDTLAAPAEGERRETRREYRLTVGNLFGSESLRYPKTEAGLAQALADLNDALNRHGAGRIKARGRIERRGK